MSFALSTTADRDPEKQPAIVITFMEDDALSFDCTDAAFSWLDSNVKGNLARLRMIRDSQRDLDRQHRSIRQDNEMLQEIATALEPHL
jgi:hypothetical protein